VNTVYDVLTRRRNNNIELYDKIINILQINHGSHFVSCFCENGDVLSQWRAYAEAGEGFSIGFNSNYFGASNYIPHFHATPQGSLFFHKVMYLNEGELNARNAYINKLLDEIERSGTDLVDTNILNFVSYCNGISKISKHQCFFEEREWRLVYMPMIMSDSVGNIKIFNAIGELKWRSSFGRIIPYFSFKLDSNNNIPPISTVVLGPKCLESINNIKLFLDAKGLCGVNVVQSTAPYR